MHPFRHALIFTRGACVGESDGNLCTPPFVEALRSLCKAARGRAPRAGDELLALGWREGAHGPPEPAEQGPCAAFPQRTAC